MLVSVAAPEFDADLSWNRIIRGEEEKGAATMASSPSSSSSFVHLSGYFRFGV